MTAAGLGDSDGNGLGARAGASIRGIGEKVDSIASVARQNCASASLVADTGRQVRALCEKLLLSVGAFRIQAHRRAARIFDQVASHASLKVSNRLEVERFLQERMRQFPIFELFYLTDERGFQRTENIWFDGGAGRGKALGRDWSGRDWFRDACETPGVTKVSDIYHSVATDSFCFTVSRAVRGKDGEILGVLAADVNFSSLLESV